MSFTLDQVARAPFEHIEEAASTCAEDALAWDSLCKAVERALAPAVFVGWKAAVNARLAELDLAPANTTFHIQILSQPMQRGDAVEIAERVSQTLEGGGAPIAYDIGTVWTFDSGVWVSLDEDDLINELGELAGTQVYAGTDSDGDPKYRGLKINSFAAPLRALRALPSKWGQGPGFFDDAPVGIAFEDCFLEAALTSQGGSIHAREPGPEHKARARFDFKYDQAALAPRFQQYLDEVWGHTEDRLEREQLLQEFAGAALLGLATRYHRALLLYGEAGAGKSTMIRIIESLFPDDTVCNIGPADFDDDDKLGLLIGARLNTLTEASQGAIFAQDRVKSIMEGEWQTLVRKWERAARFRPEAGHLYAVNEWPSVPGAGKSFWDRWLVLDLEVRIRGTDKEEKGLAARIAREERAGLVAWAVRGAKRLLEQNHYTMPPSSLELVREWKSSADAIGIWLEEEVEHINQGPWEPATRVFERFKAWASDGNFRATTRTTFGLRLRHHGVNKKKTDGTNHYHLTLRRTA